MSDITLPADYLERVYAGVLGKIIGVYLGRPVEGWLYDDIQQKLGDITYYVHDEVGVPLIVTDDDISGTFTFLRALPDHGNELSISPSQIGESWLNYIIEERTILWWGGMGNSTEHTAYLRLKRGVDAPRSGSMELNGQVVAEQIGAQIFIDGWAMVLPGRPDLAADLARRAGSVSHDGEALHAAQALAAMEAQAFVESDIERLIEVGYSFIPPDSVIATLARDLQRWHEQERDWRATREQLEAKYGYHIYGGNVHVVPNHGLILLALLYGGGRWDESMSIVNTCGWDTDCNSGNLGCLLGIRSGLETFASPLDWRGPIADRLYLPTADGGRAITDAAREAIEVANIGRDLAGLDPLRPKGGARFHFELPGSVQAFQVERGKGALRNAEGNSGAGSRSLCLEYEPGEPIDVTTATFIPPSMLHEPGYGLIASPTLHAGQHLRAVLRADQGNADEVACRLIIRHYDAADQLTALAGEPVTLSPGSEIELTWSIPGTGGQPIAAVGLRVDGGGSTSGGRIYLDLLTWDGEPDVTLTRPADGGTVWRRAWVDGTDDFSEGWGPGWVEPFRLIQNEGRGLLSQGSDSWREYEVSTVVTPHLATAAGLAVRVQGQRRYYALLLHSTGRARLVKQLDGESELAASPIAWELGRAYQLRLVVTGTRIRAEIDGEQVFEVDDHERPLANGGVGLICEEWRVAFDAVSVRPAT